MAQAPPPQLPLPAARPLFPPVALSDAAAARFKAAARALLSRTLADFDAFAQQRERRVDPARWRVVRARESLTAYAERSVQPQQETETETARQQRYSGNHRSGSTASSSSSRSSASTPSASRRAPSFPPPSSSPLETDKLRATQANYQQARPPSRSYQLPADAFDDDGHMRAPPAAVDTDRSDSALPLLLGVGWVVGSLDDVMYGVAASDCAAVFLKSAYAHSDLLDADVLCKLEGPSTRDPYRFFGVKWLVKATKGTAVEKIVAPRDLVYIEATGVIVRRATGSNTSGEAFERVGFQVIMSVSLPECGELYESHGIVRARNESCFLFIPRQAQVNGAPSSSNAVGTASCEVYATAWVDPRGRVSESVALHSCANTLLHVGNIVQCGQRKKLAWRLLNDTHGGNVIMRMNDERAERARACGICNKSFKSGLLHKKRHAVECKLCFTAMCARCSVMQTIYFADTSPRHRKTCKEVTPREFELCKSCITNTAQASALEIARDELLSGRFGHVTKRDQRSTSTSSTKRGSTTADRKKLSSSAPVIATTTASHRGPAELVDLAASHGISKKTMSFSKRSVHRPVKDTLSTSATNSTVMEGNRIPTAKANLGDFTGQSPGLSSSSHSLGSSRGPPVVLFEPTANGMDLAARRETKSNSVASSRSSKSSSSSTRGGVYDSEVEDDFDDVDEVLETSNMQHIPAPGMVKNKLFMQMAELRSVAEDVYQYTRTNTAVHLTVASGATRAKRASHPPPEL